MRKILLTTATLVAAASAFAAFGSSPSQAANAEWCSFTQAAAASNCAYTTRAQCQAFVSGVGGYCEHNAVGIRNAQARFVAPALRTAAIPNLMDAEAARLAR
jgi:Protein of unknown function (DUF3551)